MGRVTHTQKRYICLLLPFLLFSSKWGADFCSLQEQKSMPSAQPQDPRSQNTIQGWQRGFFHFFFLNKDILGAQGFSAPAVSPSCFNQCWGLLTSRSGPSARLCCRGCSGLFFFPQHRPSQCFPRQIMGFFFGTRTDSTHGKQSLPFAQNGSI